MADPLRKSPAVRPPTSRRTHDTTHRRAERGCTRRCGSPRAAAQGDAGRLGGQRAGVLRLRALRHRVGVDLREAVLPGVRRQSGPDPQLRDLRGRVPGAASRRPVLRHHGRQARTQMDPHHDHRDHGPVLHVRRPVADGRDDRRLGADLAGRACACSRVSAPAPNRPGRPC